MPAASEDVYKSFGRDTEAGKLIFNLYNSGASKRNAYKPNVHIRQKKSSQMGLTPEQEHKLKQRAKYEETRLKKSHGAPAPQLPMKTRHRPKFPMYGGKKSNNKIQAENAVNFPPIHLGPDEKYRGKQMHVEGDLRDHRIKQLQMKMEGRSERKKKPKSLEDAIPTKGGTLNMDEARAKEVRIEIEERERFLAQMKECGMADEYEFDIKAEIAKLFNELRDLDQKLTAARAQ